MVNTRKGTYTDKSSEGVLEAPSPRAAVHGTRVRGRRFQSTPPWRPYKLPSKKSHVDIPTNSDDLDDVPLARLLKKVVAPDVFPEKFADPILFVHSQESSSSEGVFVPTPGLRQTSSVEPNPSHYSPPIQSPLIHSCVSIMNLIEEAGLSKTISDVGLFYSSINFSPSSSSTDVLVAVLSGGTLSSWPVNGILAVALSVKYVILHKIDIAN